MVAPVSVTLLADLSAQPADSSVEPTVGEVVTAAAVPLEPIPITRTSVRLTSRIARIRWSGLGGSLLAAVNDMRGLLLGLLLSCQHGVRAGPSTGRFDRGDEGGIASEVPRRWRSSAILRSKRASAVGVVDPATGRSQFEGPQGLTGGCTVPPMTCAGVWTATRPAATSPCRKSSSAVNLLGVMAWAPHCAQRRWKTNCTQPPPLASAFCTYSSRVESLVAFLGLGGVRVAYGSSGGMVSA